MEKTDKDTVELRGNYLFAGLTEDQLAKVRGGMRVLRLGENERLFDHGQPAERFFMVNSGQIKLFRVSLDGIEKVIEIVKPGQTFAEAVMFMERQVYPVSAEAIAETELLSFDARVYVQLLRESTDSCFRLLADMSMRLHMRLNEIDHLTLQNATYRLIHYLVNQLPEDTGKPADIHLSTPKSVIASRLSIQPETFSRILKHLNQEGIISVHGKDVQIHDIEKLRQYGQ